MTSHVIDLGPVKITRAHDYLQFTFAILWTVLVCAVVGWAYAEGYLAEIYTTLTPLGFLLFAGFLLYGMARGLRDALVLSRAINAIKRAKLEAQELKELFGVADFSKIDVGLLKEEIRDTLVIRTVATQRVASLVVLLGLGGTVLGISLAIGEFGSLRTPEDVLNYWPQVTNRLQLAFQSTIAGLAVHLAVKPMHWLIETAAVELKNRTFRSLHENTQR